MRKIKDVLLLFILSCSVVYAQEIEADINRQTISVSEPIMQEDRTVLLADGIMSLPFDVLQEWEEVLKIKNKELAIKKAERLVGTFAAYRDRNGNLTRASFLPYVADLIDYCYYIAEIKNEPGFAATWYWALVYGMANFSLTCYGTAPGNCTGPFDVKKSPRVMDPIKNMQHHVQEQYTGWSRGYRGIGLCKYVMLPANPRDWGGGQFRRTNEKFLKCIQRGYEVGKLP